MEGIEILNVTEIYGQTWIGLIGILVLIFGFFSTIIVLVEGFVKVGIILFVATIIGGCCVYYDSTILTGYEYQAVVEDSASYKDLIQEYEIVEVKGKLFTLRKIIDETSLLSGGESK